MRLRTLLCLLALLSALGVRGADAPAPAETPQAKPQEQLSIEGTADELEYDLRTGRARPAGGATATYRKGAREGVVLRYGTDVLVADELTLSRENGDVEARGHVILLREGGQVWSGEQLRYNYKTRVINGSVFKTGQPPFFATGESFVRIPTNNAYVLTNGSFTTDDHPSPNYRIRAKRIIVIPGVSIEARHAVLYVEDVPVFYFPYYHKNLNRHENNFEFLPGFRSSWGAFLLSTYNWYYSPHLHGSLNFDVRASRGLAGGPDITFRDKPFGEVMLRYYIADDTDPRNAPGFDKTPNTRQRLLINYDNHTWTNTSFKGVLAYQTDPLIIRDFFEAEYHDNVQPKSFFEAEHQFPDWTINMLTEVRVNDFQETIERLPDLKLSGLRQQIGPTPFYYESESSAGYYRHLFPDITTNRFYPIETNAYAATRLDTYQQILLPWTFFGWLNVTPRVGERITYYSEEEGRRSTLNEETRSVLNTGAEVSWKLSRLWRQADNELLDVHGLRHIMQPSLNYVYLPDPDVRPREIPQFDRRVPSPRLLPIDYPDNRNIDSIQSENAVRLGLRNRFQTKRTEGMEDLINWNVYGDWRIDPQHGQRRFSDFFSDLEFRPRHWLTLASETRYDIGGGQFRELNHLLTIQPNDVWSIQLGHLYRDDIPELGVGNNLLRSTLFYRFNENWGFRTSHFFEARDGVLEYQYYSIYRDFRSWTGALTFRLRENHNGADDYTIALVFSLKASPRFGAGVDALHPHALIGGGGGGR
jgi:LPS-assembly protein